MSYTIKELLSLEVAPALGCTEPSAVALCAAAAATLMENSVDTIEIWLDPNLYKNGMAVSIPGASGKAGMDLAAALGVIGGDPFLKLEVLSPIDDEVVRAADALVKNQKVKMHLDPEKKGIYVRVVLRSGGEWATAVIEGIHDNITELCHNGNCVDKHPLVSEQAAGGTRLEALEAWLKDQTIKNLLGLLDTLDEQDFDFLQEGIDYNLRLSEYGLKTGAGLGVGLTFERLIRENLIQNNMMVAARRLTSAASDARMSGVKLPAMSSGGSGNHGLTATLPIWAVKDHLTIEDSRDVLRAVALSHVITAYVKAHTGRLSAVCGCSVAAGAGATAGIAYLMGGTVNHIAGAIKNLIEDLAGVICDGAKNSCSLKLATAAGTAVQSALFSLRGIQVHERDGIIAQTPEETMKNVGHLSTEGMIEADRTILKIMVNKHFDID